MASGIDPTQSVFGCVGSTTGGGKAGVRCRFCTRSVSPDNHRFPVIADWNTFQPMHVMNLEVV